MCSGAQLPVATGFAVALGVFGTAIATVICYKLVKIAGTVFTSMVTYGIPFIALGWGIFYGEKINMLQVLGLFVILGGVYIASLNISKQSVKDLFQKNKTGQTDL